MMFRLWSKGLLSSSISRQFNHFRISLHPSFSKVFVEWAMILDRYIHEIVDIGEVVENLHPTLMARITISHPPSAQASFGLGRLHQRLLDTDVTPGARSLTARVTGNVVPVGSKIFQSVLVTGYIF